MWAIVAFSQKTQIVSLLRETRYKQYAKAPYNILIFCVSSWVHTVLLNLKIRSKT